MKTALIIILAALATGCAGIQPKKERSDMVRNMVRSVPMIICGNAIGSGILFKSENSPMVLTAAHVIQSAILVGPPSPDAQGEYSSDIKVAGWDQGSDEVQWVCKADIVFMNCDIDFAILKLSSVNPNMEFARFSDKNVELGERIFMVGSPSLDASTLSEGIVSHAHRDPSVGNPCNIRYIQTDAQGYYGSSGGGIFRESNGECIGMIVMRNPSYGSMYALPIPTIENFNPIGARLLDKNDLRKSTHP